MSISSLLVKMNRSAKTKYYIHFNSVYQERHLALGNLLEHQTLVDLALCSGNNVLLAHKAILAVYCPLLKEELTKNKKIEQVLVFGCEFSVIRSLIEFIYCGKTLVDECQIKHFLALGKMLKMNCFEAMIKEILQVGELITLPKPQFLLNKPKYPSYPFNTPNVSQKSKRKCININDISHKFPPAPQLNPAHSQIIANDNSIDLPLNLTLQKPVKQKVDVPTPVFNRTPQIFIGNPQNAESVCLTTNQMKNFVVNNNENVFKTKDVGFNNNPNTEYIIVNNQGEVNKVYSNNNAGNKIPLAPETCSVTKLDNFANLNLSNNQPIGVSTSLPQTYFANENTQIHLTNFNANDANFNEDEYDVVYDDENWADEDDENDEEYYDDYEEEMDPSPPKKLRESPTFSPDMFFTDYNANKKNDAKVNDQINQI